MQKLTLDHGDSYLYALASSFYSRSRILDKAGKSDDAIDEGRGAVDLFGKLATKNPQAFNFPLATSLTTLCQHLIKLDRYDILATYVKRAANIWISLLARKPDSEAVNYHLGLAYYNLNLYLSHFGRYGKAQKFGQHAVDFFANLARKYPEYHIEAFADALHNLAQTFDRLGCCEDALRREQTAIEILLPMAQRNMNEYNEKLASFYLNHGAYAAQLKRLEDAVVSTQKAADILASFVAKNPGTFSPRLADVYSNLSTYLTLLGRFTDAIEAAGAGMEIRKTLVNDPSHSESSLAGIARSSLNVGYLLCMLERRESALTCAKGATDIFAALMATNPSRYAGELASSYQNLSNILSQLDRIEEALEYAQKAANILASPKEDESGSYASNGAQVRRNLFTLFSGSTRRNVRSHDMDV